MTCPWVGFILTTLEVVPVSSLTSETTIRTLHEIFATHGLPEIVVSDNGEPNPENFHQKTKCM